MENVSLNIDDAVAMAILEVLYKENNISKEVFEKAKELLSQV